MPNSTVEHFASALDMSPRALLDLFKSANVAKESINDHISDADKNQLLDHLRKTRGAAAETIGVRKLTPVRPYQHKLPLDLP
jgi:translation initiation factor IF-2